ncbi:MAG: cytochrome P450 [Nitrospira sp.]|nr:cytochrome P450 [Nitrospira sp.]MDH4250614.1 cytochrome P450 [Nitrospira sp.]MDH4344156.1 cytochrome P450 [Nitrospira sp.]MDH5336578.1 cytochrome P450 [Nitrospira sp.]
MIDQAILPPILSGPPVSRWWECFPDLRRDTLGFLIQCQAYGDVVKLPMGLVVELLLRQRDAAMYVLNHPTDVKHVLVTNQDNYRKAPVPPVESRIFGQGVLHTEGEIHHRQRRVLLLFFHGNHVTAYTNLITRQARDRVALWQDGTTIDIGQEMAHLTLSVIWRLLFSQDVRSESDPIRDAISVGQSLIKLQYDSLLASVTPLWVPIPRHRRFTRGFRMIEERLFQFIHERRIAAEPHDDVLSLLLSATDKEGRPLSDAEIRDELMTFLLAGHETTANALTWTWFLLSQYGSVRERLTRELNEVLGDRLPNAADLFRLRYMKMIWDESLRLYPPAWTLHTRLAHAQERLPSGAVLPPGAWVFVSPWSLHRNPRWFPDPHRFDPERFSEEAQRTRPPFSYIPFGAGGRRCLGESFAEMEGMLILATIASTVRLNLVDGQTIQPDPVMTLRPNVPVQMTVQRNGMTEPHPIVT